MYCPFCKAVDTKVIDSRLVNEGHQIRRRRECIDCHERFTTYESAELVMPKVVKRDGRRESFNECNLRAGFQKALEKRPVSIDQIEAAISDIKARLLASGEREIHSNLIGEWVMRALRQLDEIAYVRFASVYRRFQDINEFHEEISRMQKHEAMAIEGE